MQENLSNNKMANIIIGIDLGTTNSLCSFFKDGLPRLIPNQFGDYLTPSIVAFLDSEEHIVGKPAKKLLESQPEKCASLFKRLMGTDQKIKVNNKEFTAPELSSFILQSLKMDAEKFLSTPISDCVITVPAYFNDHQRQATSLAAKLANLNVKRIINEPTSASLVYGYHQPDNESKNIILDLGGGTFDVTILDAYEGTIEIISTAGNNYLGGQDFTDTLVQWVLKQENTQLEVAELKMPLKIAKLKNICNNIKERFDTEEIQSIDCLDDLGNAINAKPPIAINLIQFEELCSKLLEKIESPIDKALSDANLDPKDIDNIILVGGATKMPMIEKLVNKKFLKKPLITHDPEQVVALGAAIQAALILDDHAVDDLVMTDICPFTLGVNISKKFGQRIIDGYFLPIIHRNSTIPISREEIVNTIYDNQRELLIEVFQGESRKVNENIYLGKLTINNIPPSPAGLEVCLRFTYDINGILDVEAFIPSIQKKFNVVLTNNVNQLNEEKIQKALEKIREIKYYPRDELENRQLLTFAEKVLKEIAPLERERLEELIDHYEQTMSISNKEAFLKAKEDLLLYLSSIGEIFDPNIDK